MSLLSLIWILIILHGNVLVDYQESVAPPECISPHVLLFRFNVVILTIAMEAAFVTSMFLGSVQGADHHHSNS